MSRAVCDSLTPWLLRIYFPWRDLCCLRSRGGEEFLRWSAVERASRVGLEGFEDYPHGAWGLLASEGIFTNVILMLVKHPFSAKDLLAYINWIVFLAYPPHFGGMNLLYRRCTKGLEAWGGCARTPSYPSHIPLIFVIIPPHFRMMGSIRFYEGVMRGICDG